MITKTISRSTDVADARARFLDQIQAWAYECVDKYGDAAPTDVHDQATYTTGWAPYIEARGDARLPSFLKRLRDEIREHFVTTGQWHHGYWREQEAHHGTEHFELFLGTLNGLDPAGGETNAQLLDAAEHIGNWVPGIPPWFDTTSGLFRSMYLGTRIVQAQPGMELNIPDHLRFVNLCLLAYRISEDDRYRAFADAYAFQWVEAILSDPRVPLGLLPSGPVYELRGEAEAAYRDFAGMAGHLDDDVDRTENLLASNGIGAMLSLWQITKREDYVSAVERLLDVLSTQLSDPDAGPAADAIRSYRRLTGRRRYDEAVQDAWEQAVADVDPFGIEVLGIDPHVQRPSRPHGIGKRVDMPTWYEDGRPRRHNPILLSVVAEIRWDFALAVCALDLARTYFELARETLADGRHHGCAANTVSAVARGHGRDNHAGMVTAVVGKLSERDFAG